jgi:hypothetical protein
MTTATAHLKQAHANLTDAARSFALALQHSPESVNKLSGFERELLLRHGLKQHLLRAERQTTGRAA